MSDISVEIHISQFLCPNSCYLPSSMDIFLIFLKAFLGSPSHFPQSSSIQDMLRKYLALLCPSKPSEYIQQHFVASGPMESFPPIAFALSSKGLLWEHSKAHLISPYSITQLVLGLINSERLQRVVWRFVLVGIQKKNKPVYQALVMILYSKVHNQMATYIRQHSLWGRFQQRRTYKIFISQKPHLIQTNYAQKGLTSSRKLSFVGTDQQHHCKQPVPSHLNTDRALVTL